ncbi:hypothetical protein ACQPZF_27410 [Actinosynnema sp. CS-041913]|uniref:hypothetical protein n=1 Tax=Actinosynnema sp. CS-041913 TaxID=3239917 RepID=UPI003D8D7E1F
MITLSGPLEVCRHHATGFRTAITAPVSYTADIARVASALPAGVERMLSGTSL